MRKYHRWVMTVFGILLSYWVVSGLVMAIYDLTDHNQIWAIQGSGPGARLTDFAIDAQAIAAPASYAAGLAAAVAKAGSLQIASADLRMVGHAARFQLADAGGDRDTERRFYADTGASMDDAVADAAINPSNYDFRTTLKAWHRGNIVGLPGQFVGLSVGIALITLTITGVWFYFQLWNGRRKIGKKEFFWSGRESIWRRLHRWSAIVAAVFVLNIGISGTILAWGEIQLNVFLKYHIGFVPYPRPAPLAAVSSGALPRDIPTLLQNSYQAARAVAPDAKIAAITLVERGDGVAKGLVILAGDAPKTLAFNAQTGMAVTDWATGGAQVGAGYFADWHQMLKRFHRGDIIGGFMGRFIDISAGIALLYLVVSSFVMYVNLLLQRAKLGRKGLFW